MKKIVEKIIYYLTPKVYYFAYGSNMSLKRIQDRIGYCKKISNFELEGYSLKFNYGNSKFSFANLIENENDKVEGVVYKITRNQLELLDYSEGVGNPNYYSRMVDLYKKKPLHFYISFNTRNEFSKPISEDYFLSLWQGCIENNLFSYKSHLVKMDDNIAINEKFMYK